MTSHPPLLKYTIRFTRHAQAESNAPGLEGSHILDPILTTSGLQQQWREARIRFDHGVTPGLDYAKNEISKELEDDFSQGRFRDTVVISFMTRAAQTYLAAATSEMLRTTLLVLQPLAIEQTIWFSDRPREPLHWVAHIEAMLRWRRQADMPDVNFDDLLIDWSHVLDGACLARMPRSQKDMDVSTARGFHKITKEQVEDLCKKSAGTTKPYQLKVGLWSPKKLKQRGTKMNEFLLERCRVIYKRTGRTDQLSVVGHGGFVNFMTAELGDILKVEDGRPASLTDWLTGETREFYLYDDWEHSPVGGFLYETDHSYAEHALAKGTAVAWPRELDKRKEASRRDALLHEVDSKKCGIETLKNRDRKWAQIFHLYKKADADRANPIELSGNNIMYVADILKASGRKEFVHDEK